MDIRKYLPFARLGHEAAETDSQAKEDLGMHLLYDGTRKEEGQTSEEAREDSQPCLEPVDIIAVHGLGGGALSTWRHPVSNTIWLQTLLPVAMPISRIMSYGYDATISASQNTLHVMNNAEDLLFEIQAQRRSQKLQSRRIILIGHSMGGIIIKKALNMAQGEEKYQSILHLTNGVMFMGTPHNGAKAADLACSIINIANLVTKLNSQQLEMLKSGSESLQDISRSFGQLSELKIVSVIESNKTYIPWTQKFILIVPQDSARLNLGHRETVFSISNADHRGVCKFRGEDDMQYSKIEFAIKTLATTPTVNRSPDVIELQKRLHSIDESISHGRRKFQKIMDEESDHIRSSLDALKVQSERQHAYKLRNSTLNILSTLIKTSKKCIREAPGTGVAFLQTKTYKDWVIGPASFLWLYGRSGTGKTVLCSTITKNISERCASGTATSAVASVYCSWNEQDIASLIATLLSDLIGSISEVPQDSACCIERCKSNRDNEADLSEALRCILTHLNNAYILIDGLDEWLFYKGSRSTLLDWIASLEEWNLPHLHILVTSQRLPDIEKRLSDKCSIRINPRPDILTYIGHELHMDPLTEFDCSLQFEIEKCLLENGEGFRWVALQFMELKSCGTATEVRETLRTLPKTLEEYYERIFCSVPQRHQNRVRAALQWIACSARPLTIDELAVAVVIDPDAEESCEPLSAGSQAIHQMLSKLIDVEKVEPASLEIKVKHESFPKMLDHLHRCVITLADHGLNPNLTAVKFSHSSVREYVLQQQDGPIPPSRFSFSMDTANRFVARSCLAYIQDPSEQSCAKLPGLLMYLIRYWHVHAARLPNEEPASLIRLFNETPIAQKLLMSGKDEYTGEPLDVIVGWDEYTGEPPDDIVGWDAAQMKPPSSEQQLRYAACCGSHHAINGIFQSNSHLDIDACSKFCGNALSLACERGHLQAVKALLKAGADPNKYRYNDSSPLYLASEHGFDSIVRELIDHGAKVDVESDDDNERTPLIKAIIYCDLSTVRYLLVNGASPDWPTDERPIAVAVGCAKYECIILLLEHGASLEDRGGPSLLELASGSGSVRVVKFLLERGLDVNDENRLKAECEDPVSLDTRYRFDYPTIRFSWSSQCYVLFSYGSALHAAAASGHTEVIKVLIENNAAVNVKSHYWETPSTLASVRGHKAALEYLLKNGGSAEDMADVCYRRDIFLQDSDYSKEFYNLRRLRGR